MTGRTDFIVARLGINALITTLATMQIVRGLVYLASDGKAVGVGHAGFLALGITEFYGVPVSVLIMIVCFVVFGLLLNRTMLGGVSLTGGIATISGVVVGVLIMGTVQNAMNLLNMPPFYQYVASGLILLTAVICDRFRHRWAG